MKRKIDSLILRSVLITLLLSTSVWSSVLYFMDLLPPVPFFYPIALFALLGGFFLYLSTDKFYQDKIVDLLKN